MPTYQQPVSDHARFLFLQKARQTAALDLAAGNNYITQQFVTSLATFVPQFETKLKSISEKLSGRSKEIREKNQAIETVQVYVRDMWEVVKRRVGRMQQPAEVLNFYELPLSGVVPKPSLEEEWMILAKKMVDGDAKAVTAGYPAMQNPSAAELNAVVQSAEAEIGEVALADRGYDQAQEALAAIRTQADTLIQEVMDQLRFALRSLDAASQRRIMRTYGATFAYLPGEPPDEPEEVPPEIPTP